MRTPRAETNHRKTRIRENLSKIKVSKRGTKDNACPTFYFWWNSNSINFVKIWKLILNIPTNPWLQPSALFNHHRILDFFTLNHLSKHSSSIIHSRKFLPVPSSGYFLSISSHDLLLLLLQHLSFEWQ